MKEVIIYTTKTCPYCFKAKRLFKKLDIAYKEISVDFNPKLRAEMAAKAGKYRKKVPHNQNSPFRFIVILDTTKTHKLNILRLNLRFTGQLHQHIHAHSNTRNGGERRAI